MIAGARSSLLVSLVALPAALAAGEGCRPHEAATHRIRIEQFQFEPAVTTVRTGDTLVFVNADVVPHTATAGDSAWDSGAIAPGAEWSTVVPEEWARSYFCRFHPTMRGTLSLQ